MPGCHSVSASVVGSVVLAILVHLLTSLQFELPWQSSFYKVLDLGFETSTNGSDSDGCTIKRVSNISCEEFVNVYMGKQPVIIRRSATPTALQNQKTFAKICKKKSLVEYYSDLPARVSTANAYTGREWLETTLGEYLKKWLRPQSMNNPKGNETYYFFGSQFGEDWEKFLSLYTFPIFPSESLKMKISAKEMPKEISERGRIYCEKTDLVDRTLSFGIGGRNTGVPFHFHGPGFLEMLHGRKRFLLYPPKNSLPLYDPNVTTLHWTRVSLPLLEHENRPLDCILEPGDIIYFPDEWLHGTLNLDDYNVFMATFA